MTQAERFDKLNETHGLHGEIELGDGWTACLRNDEYIINESAATLEELLNQICNAMEDE